MGRYGRDIAEHMADTFLRFSKTSIRNIGKACVVGNTPDIPEDMQERIWFDWGEKELYAKTSKPLIEKLYPKANIIVRSGYEHCEYMMKKNSNYICKLINIIEQEELS